MNSLSEYIQKGKSGITLSPPPQSLVVSPESILRGMDMKPGDADDYLLALIDNLISECISLTTPVASCILFESSKFSLTHNEIYMEDAILNIGKIVANSLKKSSLLGLFVATCGHGIETYSKKMMKEGHALEGLIIDLIGSETAESIVEMLHQKIELNVSPFGFHVSNRYSPGYCNWPVSDQHKFFSLMKGNTCDITLTDSSLMLPVKSVSGIIGIGPTLKKAPYKCKVCPELKCIMRIR